MIRQNSIESAERVNMQAEQEEKQRCDQLDKEAARIIAEMDSGEYFSQIVSFEDYKKQWGL